MDTITLSTAIIGVVGFIKSLPKVGPQVTGFITPIVAVVLGVVFALVNNGNPVTGAFAGLVAVGAITTVSKIGYFRNSSSTTLA